MLSRKEKIMKNRFFTTILSVFGLIFVSSTMITGQSGITFKSGITIFTKTEAIFGDAQKTSIRPLDEWETVEGKEILHRRLVDAENGIYFGYSIEVSRGAEANKFNVSIKPLSYKSGSNPEAEKAELEKYNAVPLPKFPNEKIIESGDIIRLDLLENPDKKIKVIDYLKISDKSNPFSTSFSELQPTRDFTIDDVYIRLENYELIVNGKFIAKVGGGARAANVYFTVPDKGRFIVSAFPREGYNLQKIGTIIDNKLSFTSDGNKYEIISKSPILSDRGNWHAWILADPNYKPRFHNSKNPNSIETGATGNIKYFFTETNLNEK